ncbi:bifunctional pyr operon transcriptional regulator/uracil phosphoribosyltransferase PyrR [Candidatus Venteria ishoeyi]|nr:bifunctional pyr operon transcriptional regulator/uracil phosphoribosyltransferase PyrR [Candidatus Venteria ishoeyi]
MANTLKTEMTATPATDNANTEMPLMIGIHTGGVWIAEHLHELLALQEPLGRLNIAFYRDDFSEIGLHPRVEASDLPTMDITGRHIILVDDVLYTGRTIRAALNEIFDYGRPAKVTLAVLVERNGRQLPIQADVVGMHIELSSEEYLQLDGPDSFVLSVSKKSS